jgi:hypothetical protein
MEGEQHGMSIHLNLLAEEAEEALRQQASFHEQATIVALDVRQAKPGPIKRLMARIARRHGG